MTGRTTGIAICALASLAAVQSGCYGSSDIFESDTATDTAMETWDTEGDPLYDEMPDLYDEWPIDTWIADTWIADTPMDTWITDTWTADTPLDTWIHDTYPDTWGDVPPDGPPDWWDVPPDPWWDTYLDTADTFIDTTPVGNVGDACSGDYECAGAGPGGYCMTDIYGFLYFPGGYCTSGCASVGGCGAGAACVDVMFTTLCLVTCAASDECRTSESYACMELPFFGGGPYCLPSG